MTGSIKDVTPNFKFIIPRFNVGTWHDYIENNFRSIDALIQQFYTVINYQGAWETNKIYNKDDVVFIAVDRENSEYISRLFKIIKDGGINTTGYTYFSDMYDEHPEYYELYLTVIDVSSAVEDAQEAAETANNAVESITEMVGNLTANTVVVTDADKNLTSSTTTATQIGWLSTLTDNVQTQLNDKVSKTSSNTISGANTFTSTVYFTGVDNLRKKCSTVDISTDTYGTGNNQFWFYDKNNKSYLTLQANQADTFNDGRIVFSITGKSKEDNDFITPLYAYFFRNGSGEVHCLTPANNSDNDQIATTQWVRRKNYLRGLGKVSISLSINSEYTVTDDGILSLSIKTGYHTSTTGSTVIIKLIDSGTASASYGYNVAEIGSYCTNSNEFVTTPVIIPVKKNQSIYVYHNGNGVASVERADLFKYITD